MVRKVMDKARTRGPVRALDRLTTKVDGQHRIVEDAPLIVHETTVGDGVPMAEALGTGFFAPIWRRSRRTAGCCSAAIG